MEKAEETLTKRVCMKLILTAQLSHAPISVYVKPWTKQLSIWDSDTKEVSVHTIQGLPNYSGFTAGVTFINAYTVLICGGSDQ